MLVDYYPTSKLYKIPAPKNLSSKIVGVKSQSFLDNLIESMRVRCAILLSVRGNYTLHYDTF